MAHFTTMSYFLHLYKSILMKTSDGRSKRYVFCNKKVTSLYKIVNLMKLITELLYFHTCYYVKMLILSGLNVLLDILIEFESC